MTAYDPPEFRYGSGETTVPRPPAPSPRVQRPIPPPDWEAERLEALARERAQQEQARARFLEQELARIAAEDEHTYPKPPSKKRRWRT